MSRSDPELDLGFWDFCQSLVGTGKVAERKREIEGRIKEVRSLTERLKFVQADYLRRMKPIAEDYQPQAEKCLRGYVEFCLSSGVGKTDDRLNAIETTLGRVRDFQSQFQSGELRLADGTAVKDLDSFTNLLVAASSGPMTAAIAWTLVSSLGTASTGTAIGGLSGAAAFNATLAWFGGGALAAGTGGMALGALTLGGIIVLPLFIVIALFYFHEFQKYREKMKEALAQLTEQIEQGTKALRTIERGIENEKRYVEVMPHLLEELGTELRILESRTNVSLFSAGRRRRKLAALMDSAEKVHQKFSKGFLEA